MVFFGFLGRFFVFGYDELGFLLCYYLLVLIRLGVIDCKGLYCWFEWLSRVKDKIVCDYDYRYLKKKKRN